MACRRAMAADGADEPPVIAGHSLGGILAAIHSALYPEALRAEMGVLLGGATLFEPSVFGSQTVRENVLLGREDLELGTAEAERVLRAAVARLSPDGVLYFSNNFRKFQLDPGLAERYAVEEISAATIDPRRRPTKPGPPLLTESPRVCWRLG